jgi:hypothetical protein
MPRTIGESAAQLKVSILQFGISLTALLHLLSVIRNSGWQLYSVPQFIIFLVIFFFTVSAGCLTVFKIKADRLPAIFGFSIFFLLFYINFILKFPFKIHGLVFYSSSLMILSLAPIDSGRALRWFRTYIYLLYFLAAISKLRLGFLSGVALESFMVRNLFGSLPFGTHFGPAFYQTLAGAVVAAEILIPVLLWTQRFRQWGVFAVIIFQIVSDIMVDKTFFTMAILVSMVAFFKDEKLRHWLDVT